MALRVRDLTPPPEKTILIKPITDGIAKSLLDHPYLFQSTDMFESFCETYPAMNYRASVTPEREPAQQQAQEQEQEPPGAPKKKRRVICVHGSDSEHSFEYESDNGTPPVEVPEVSACINQEDIEQELASPCRVRAAEAGPSAVAGPSAPAVARPSRLYLPSRGGVCAWRKPPGTEDIENFSDDDSPIFDRGRHLGRAMPINMVIPDEETAISFLVENRYFTDDIICGITNYHNITAREIWVMVQVGCYAWRHGGDPAKKQHVIAKRIDEGWKLLKAKWDENKDYLEAVMRKFG